MPQILLRLNRLRQTDTFLYGQRSSQISALSIRITGRLFRAPGCCLYYAGRYAQRIDVGRKIQHSLISVNVTAMNMHIEKISPFLLTFLFIIVIIFGRDCLQPLLYFSFWQLAQNLYLRL